MLYGRVWFALFALKLREVIFIALKNSLSLLLIGFEIHAPTPIIFPLALLRSNSTTLSRISVDGSVRVVQI